MFYFTSLKWLLPIQSNQKSSAVCPMPAPAKGSSKTASLRIHLLITCRETWHTTAKEHPWNFRIKTCQQDYSTKLGIIQKLGIQHRICIGSQSCLHHWLGMIFKNAGLRHHFFALRFIIFSSSSESLILHTTYLMLWTRNAVELHKHISEFTSSHLNILEWRKLRARI